MRSDSSNFVWSIIYVLVICSPLLFILTLTLFKICKLEQRLNCNFVCIGYRNRYVFIPLYLTCRSRRNNTIIVPLKKIELYTENEFCNETGNVIIIYPNNIKYIGIK
jgi:hypothetical protein